MTSGDNDGDEDEADDEERDENCDGNEELSRKVIYKRNVQAIKYSLHCRYSHHHRNRDLRNITRVLTYFCTRQAYATYLHRLRPLQITQQMLITPRVG